MDRVSNECYIWKVLNGMLKLKFRVSHSLLVANMAPKNWPNKPTLISHQTALIVICSMVVQIVHDGLHRSPCFLMNPTFCKCLDKLKSRVPYHEYYDVCVSWLAS